MTVRGHPLNRHPPSDSDQERYGNLVELAALQQHVARELGRPVGRLLMIVKSAHVYETERGYVPGVLAAEDALTADGEVR